MIVAMEKAWPVLLVFVFVDCMQGVENSNIQGLGLVKKVRYVTMVDYWVVGIPVSLITMFKFDLGLAGLWLGPTIACALNWGIYYHYTSSVDWDKVAEETVKRLEEEKKALESEKDT